MGKVFNFSYRKVGGLHFVKLGRFGCSFYVSKPVIEAKAMASRKPVAAFSNFSLLFWSPTSWTGQSR